MGAPQVTLLLLWAMTITYCAVKHGETRYGHYNLGAELIGVGIYAGILYWGGFF